MKKTFSTKVIAEIAIFAAVALALDFFASGIWRFAFVNGGSISFAAVPVIFVAYRRGFLPGLLCGLLVSLLQMLGGIYAIASNWYNVLLQILLDYVVAYPLIAMAGIFSKKFRETDDIKKKRNYLIFGCILGCMLKFLSHFLAGVIFWSDSIAWKAFENSSVLYSLVYNGAYCIPNLILTTIILVIILMKQPKFFEVDHPKEVEE